MLAEFVLPVRVKSLPERTFARTYYTEALRDYLLNKSDILGETYQERYNQLFRGGLRIHTTLDSNLQALAEQARNQLPDTPSRLVNNFDASIVSLDSTTGAIRVMVGGRGFVPNEREVNMALSPRQTGSSVKMFILAAAVQAGAQQNDLLDGPRQCTLPNPGNEAEPFEVGDTGDSTGIGLATLQEHTTKSINCAFARLSQIVGLNRVVDTIYRMSESPYLYRDQPREERRPIEPFASLTTGANEMSPLDMAQVSRRSPTKVCTTIRTTSSSSTAPTASASTPTSTRVLRCSIEMRHSSTVEILKGPIYGGGTGRRAGFVDRRPAFGKTGTQQFNTNAWFVGGTKQLSTAVWVGDPNAYTEMRSVPEFVAAGYGSNVQGGHFPAVIWNTFMEPAHTSDCRYSTGKLIPPSAPECTTLPAGQRVRIPQWSARRWSVPRSCRRGLLAPPPPWSRRCRRPTPPRKRRRPPRRHPRCTVTITAPIIQSVEVGTTIPPDNLDPLAPLPSLPITAVLGPC